MINANRTKLLFSKIWRRVIIIESTVWIQLLLMLAVLTPILWLLFTSLYSVSFI